MDELVNGDPFDLHRFVAAQADVFDDVLEELKTARKRSHWMWFVFPQLRGLGSSSTSRFYGIASLDEARAYLAHPVLGDRLRHCTRLVAAAVPRTSLRAIFGQPDDLKFRSSMTLFAIAANDDQSIFHEALARTCSGIADEETLALLRGGERASS